MKQLFGKENSPWKVSIDPIRYRTNTARFDSRVLRAIRSIDRSVAGLAEDLCGHNNYNS